LADGDLMSGAGKTGMELIGAFKLLPLFLMKP
jgi:hypothetical protein